MGETGPVGSGEVKPDWVRTGTPTWELFRAAKSSGRLAAKGSQIEPVDQTPNLTVDLADGINDEVDAKPK